MENKKLINGYPFVQHTQKEFSENETKEKASVFYGTMNERRSCRDFSNKPIPKEVIETLFAQHLPHQAVLTNNHGHFV